MSREYQWRKSPILRSNVWNDFVHDEISEGASPAGSREILNTFRRGSRRQVASSIFSVGDADDDETRNGAAAREESNIGDGEVELGAILGVQDDQHAMAVVSTAISLRRGYEDRALLFELRGIDDFTFPQRDRAVLRRCRRCEDKEQERCAQSHRNLPESSLDICLSGVARPETVVRPVVKGGGGEVMVVAARRM